MPDANEQNDFDLAIADVEQNIGILVGRIRLVWKESAASIHPELQPVGYKILNAIVRLGEANAYMLAEMLETDKSVVSRQVRMLEEAELVTSRADEKDGRVRVLSPTPAAIERVKAVRAHQQQRLRDILRSRTEEEIHAFAAMLRLIGGA